MTVLVMATADVTHETESAIVIGKSLCALWHSAPFFYSARHSLYAPVLVSRWGHFRHFHAGTGIGIEDGAAAALRIAIVIANPVASTHSHEQSTADGPMGSRPAFCAPPNRGLEMPCDAGSWQAPFPQPQPQQLVTIAEPQPTAQEEDKQLG